LSQVNGAIGRLLAEKFSLPSHIVELTDAQALESQFGRKTRNASIFTHTNGRNPMANASRVIDQLRR
jgi:hypothetical protein